MEILKLASKLRDGKHHFAIATVVAVKGSVPQVTGSKMLIEQDGKIWGTIGGGKIEFEVIKQAKELLKKDRSELKEFLLEEKHLGMLCGGKMKVFIEVFNPKKDLVIVGAGHVGLALYKLGKILGFNITVIDNRKSFANKRRFPDAEVKAGDYEKILKKLPLDKNSFVAIATHGHAFDYICLKSVIKSKAFYIGMIGSKPKIKETFNRLIKAGVARKLLKKVHSPIGLDIGANTPEEIALSILAEMTAESNRCKGSLRFSKKF